MNRPYTTGTIREDKQRYTLSDLLVGVCLGGYVVAYFISPLQNTPEHEQDRPREEQRIEVLDDIKDETHLKDEAGFRLDPGYSIHNLLYEMPVEEGEKVPREHLI